MQASIADPSLGSSGPVSKDALVLLERKLLDLAFGKVKFSVIAALVLAVLIVAALWSVIEHERLLAWLAGIAAVKALHFLYLHRYKRHGHRADVHPGKWKTGLAVGAAAAGLGWGSAVFCFPSSPFNPLTLFGVFVLPSTPFDPVTVLLIFILAGVTAYASVAMAFVPLAAIAFFACAWLPLAIWLFSFGEQMYVVMGLIALSYLGVMVLLSRRMYATVCSLISVSEENRGLRTAQQESDWRMSRFFESAPGFFYTASMSPDGKTCMPFASAGIQELFDVMPGDVADSMAPLFAKVRADDLELIVKEREASRRDLSPFHIEFRINHSERGERWIELHSRPHRDPDGSTNWHGYMQDITGRKRLEVETRRQSDFQQTLLDAINEVGLQVMVIENGCIEFASNRKINREFGYSEADEAARPKLMEIVHPDDRARVMDMHRRRLAGEPVPATYELALITRSGDRREYETSISIVPGTNPVRVITVGKDITERKRMEAELQRREQEFRTLAENFPDVVIRYDLDGRRTYVNRALAELAGVEPDEMLGKFLEDTPLLDPEAYTAELNRVIATRDTAVLEVTARGTTGEISWYQARFVPEFDAGGNVSSVLMVAGDITAHKRMEEVLHRSEVEYRTLAANLPVAVIRYDDEQRRRYINPAAERMLHGDAAELLGKEPGDGGVPATPEMIAFYRGKMAEVLASGEASELEFVLDALPQERQEHYAVRFAPEYDAEGKAAGVLAIWFDITEHKRLSGQLQESRERYLQIFDNAQEGMFLLEVTEDMRFRVLEANETFARLIGIAHDEMCDKFVEEVLLPETAQKVAAKYRRCVDSGDALREEQELLLPVGLHTYDTTLVPVRDEAGRIYRLVGITSDITERKRMEEELRLKERVLDQAHDGVYLIDENARFVYVNDQACRALGYSREELLGMGVADIDAAYTVEDSNAVGRKSKEEGAFAFETQHRRRDGSLFPVEIQASALDYRGKHLGLALVRDITERKEAQKRLEMLDLAVNQASDAMFVQDATFRFVSVNDAACRSLGYSREELLNMSTADIDPDFPREVLEQAFATAELGKSNCFETRHRTKDGRMIPVELTGTFFEIGGVRHAVSMVRDIAERKAIEKSLHDSERMLQEAQRIAHVGSWDVDMVNDKLTWSDEIFRIWEIDKTKFKADFAAFLETVHPDDRERVNRVYNEAVANHTLYEVEHRLLFPDGRIKHILERGEPQYDGQGKPVRFIGTSLDITERKRMEESLVARERDFRSLAGNIPDNIARWDTAGRYLYVNPTHERLLGRKLEDLVGQPIPDSHEQVKAGVAQVAATGQAIHAVRQPVMVDGVEELHDVSLVPEFDETGKVVGVLGIGRDMTERYRMLETIAVREQEFRSLAENMPDCVVRWDKEGRYTYINPLLERVLGASLCEIAGKRPSEAFPDGRFEPLEIAIGNLFASGGGAVCVPQLVPIENGQMAFHEVSLVVERNVAGEVIGVLGIGRDVTERKRMESQIAQERAMLRAFFGAMPDLAWMKDTEGRYLACNPMFEQLYGRAEAEILGKTDFDFVDAELASFFRKKDKEAEAAGKPCVNEEWVTFTSDGRRALIETVKAPVFNSEGKVVGVIGVAHDITERKRMEGALAERQAFLNSLFEAIPVPVFYKDREGRYLGFNRAYESVFGANREQLIGKSVFDTHPRELAETYHAKDVEVFERRVELQQYEYQIRHTNGTLRDVLFSKAAFTDAQGEVSGLIGAVIDITERKQAEEALRHSEQLMRAVVDATPDWVFIKDREHRYRLANKGYADALHIAPEDFVGKDDLDLGFPEELVKGDPEKGIRGFWADDRLVLDSNEMQVYPDDPATIDGEVHTFHTIKVPLRDADGKPWGVLAFARDISERKKTELALRASEEKIRSLYELSPLGIALTDMQGRYVEFNEAFCAICGYPADELMALDYWTLTPREYEAQEALQLESLAQTGRYGPYEKEYRQKDGTLIPIQLNGMLVTGRDGEQYIWSIVEDITARKRSELLLKEKFERIVELNDLLEENARNLEEQAVELEAQTVELQASQEHLKDTLEFTNGVINALPDLLFEMDRDGRYMNVWAQNPELLAAQKRVLLGHTLDEMLAPESAAISLDAIREAEANGVSTGKVIWVDLPQGKRWFELSVSHKAGAAPSDARFLVLSRDVTERKQTEDVLRFVADGEWLRGGEPFPVALVRHLGKLLDVDYVVIDKADYEPGYVETVARYVKGEIAPNVRYALQSTPCGEVMAGVHCCHGENIRERFPESGLLRDMAVESYVGIPLLDIEGKAIGLIAVLHEQPLGDVNFVKSLLQMVAPAVAAELERSRMEQVLRENYDALNEAQRISQVGNWELDLASGTLLWSDEIYRIFEIDPEMFGASYDAFLNAVHPDDRDAVSRAYETSLETRAPYEIEHRLLMADGRIKYVHERCETHYADDGKPLRSLGTVQDITARKQAEESLRESYDKITELNRHLEKNALHLEENARNLEEQATELEASQEQLKQTEAWYRSILHSAPDGMLVVDDRGLIMQVNARLEAMFGYEAGELPGQSVEVLLPQVVREAHVGQRDEYFASGAMSRPAMVGKTLSGCRKDGSTFPVDVSLSRLPELDGRRSAICASVRDITERQAMEVARETALAEAQRLVQLRSAFMAQMSHELRTPLNGILGYTQNLLQGDALGEKQVAGLNIIRHSGEHLLSLINGLLDHAAIEAGKFELIEADIELDPFLSAIIGIIRVRVEQKNLTFTCDAGGDLPAVVRGDAQRLRQVLINLLANAVKFTDRGDVILRVRMAAPSRIRFEVQDSGVGIAADQLENIFLPFEQTGEIQRRAGGSGLGLAISRTLVRLMGGDIRVESRPGAGSTFSFEIEIGAVQSGRGGLDAAALSERAETRAAQATPMLLAPPREELDTLHALALRGSMRAVTQHADKLAEADARYQPFAAQLRRLAQSFQTKALRSLIEQYRGREQEE